LGDVLAAINDELHRHKAKVKEDEAVARLGPHRHALLVSNHDQEEKQSEAAYTHTG